MEDHGCVTWRERLENASVTAEMLNLAQHWYSCAVGEQGCLHPLIVLDDVSGSPKDEKLWALGLGFYHALWEHNRSKAKQILDQIEDRVLELKRLAE